MIRSMRHLGLLLAALLVVAWRLFSNAPAAVPSACQIVSAGEDVMIYTRPSVEADVFAPLGVAEFPVVLGAKTADGWLGFEPGVAQAANMGVFRLRWILAAQVQVKGNCEALPEVVGPPPGICFTMPMEDTAVYTEPNNTAAIVATLTVGQYAAVSETTDAGWAKLDLGLGNSGIKRTGWVLETTLNVNGHCEGLFTH